MKKLLAVALAAAASGSMAAPITPSYTTFGNLAGATFGGSGIPTDPTAITEIGAVGAAPQITLGLAATQRFSSNPALTNNGAGRYGAKAGIDTNAPSSPADPYATWNFDFYLSGALASYNYQLFYDFDPAAATDQSAHGVISVPGAAIIGSPWQDSWNLGMDFLDIAALGLVPPPSFGAFDPTSTGEYTFALVAYDQAGAEVGRSAIAVDVTAVPEPTSLALVALALLGVAGVSRRKA